MKFKLVLCLNLLSLGVILAALWWLGLKVWGITQANLNISPSTVPQVAATPPMGWNGWNYFGCDPVLNEDAFLAMVDAIVASGLQEAGYEYVNLDDCWQADRDAQGQIIIEEFRFPSGIKRLSEYVRSQGLKFGIYTSGGNWTCERRPGSFGHEFQDVQTYREWGVEYIKVDWCGIEYLDTFTQYSLWREAIKESGQPMVLSVAIAAIDSIENNKVWLWGGETGQLWRTARDLQGEWSDVLRVFDRNSRYSEYSRPGAWNDADMLQVGNGRLTPAENRSHFTMWAMMASPLIVGTDVRAMPWHVRNILTNQEVIAIDQDPLGRAANLVSDTGDLEVWSKVLTPPGGQRAVMFLNRSDSEADMNVTWGELGLFHWVKVRDVWSKKDIGWVKDGYTATVPPHGVVLLRLSGLNRALVSQIPELPFTVGTGYLTDQQAIIMPTLPALQPAVIDSAQRTITLRAGSDVRYNLSGRCQRLKVTVGLDRERSDVDAAVKFKIYANGKLVAEQSNVTYFEEPIHMTVELKDVRVINLETVSTQPRSELAQTGIWSQPYIECDL